MGIIGNGLVIQGMSMTAVSFVESSSVPTSTPTPTPTPTFTATPTPTATETPTPTPTSTPEPTATPTPTPTLTPEPTATSTPTPTSTPEPTATPTPTPTPTATVAPTATPTPTPDGTLGTLDNPAISATQLYNAGITTSGWYYIKTARMASASQVFCNQTDEGGGWMLVSYNPSGSTAGQTGYLYPNQWISGSGTLNKHSVNVEDLWFSSSLSSSVQCRSVMRMATGASVQPFLSSCSIAHTVTYANPEILDLPTGSGAFTLKLSSPLTGSWTSVKGYTLMSGSYPVAAPCDWLYDAANWWTVAGPTNVYPDAPYGRSGNALGTGGWTNRSSNQIYGLVNVATNANSTTAGLITLAVYIR